MRDMTQNVVRGAVQEGDTRKKTIEATTRATETMVKTTRFGELHIAAGKSITLEKPILGFENYRFFILVESEEMAPFIWLQSMEAPELAFLLINPTLFFPDYSIEVNPKEVEDIGVVDGSEVETYVIVTAPGNPREMTANLQGPIVINTFTRQSKQLALVNSRYSVCEPLIAEESVAEETIERNTSRTSSKTRSKTSLSKTSLSKTQRRKETIGV